MLDRHWIREHVDDFKAALAARGSAVDVEGYLGLERRRRELIQEVEERKHRRKKASEEIGAMKKAGGNAEERQREMRSLGEEISALEAELSGLEAQMEACEYAFPNVPDPGVPMGKGSEENIEVRRWGRAPEFAFAPKAHWDIGEALDILDFRRAAKVAGARFTVLKGKGALLERALIQFMLDLHTREHGYTEVLPPFMVNRQSLVGTGQLPKFEEDLFRLQGLEYFLIPTAEVPVTNLHRDEILAVEQLPLRYAAYTPCFRSEAGSYGKDTRGYIRQHQFNKVELVQFTRPEDSDVALESLTRHAEEVLRRLELHYRVVALCAGDLGFASAKTYDLEVWFPSEGVFKEISSCSNFRDFQARRAAIRFRPDAKSKPQLVHTLNGSGLAVGRTLAAILENYQNADGTVRVPSALQLFMGGIAHIP